jgi:membrane-associated phospholipid phosphatase
MLSIVYLGEHYVVDALDGFLYVAAATVLVEGFVRWRAHRSSPRPATPSA